MSLRNYCNFLFNGAEKYMQIHIITFKNSISWDNQTSKNSILVLIRF